MAFLELKKYRETSKDKIRKPWLEFFGNKPFTQQPERAISQADQLLDYKSWSEEDRKMFSQLRMREEQALLAQDYALETARAEGIEQGLELSLIHILKQVCQKLLIQTTWRVSKRMNTAPITSLITVATTLTRIPILLNGALAVNSLSEILRTA